MRRKLHRFNYIPPGIQEKVPKASWFARLPKATSEITFGGLRSSQANRERSEQFAT
jgi:hypothetical protein